MNADERIAVGHFLMAGGVEAVARLAYPTAYALHDPSGPWGMEQQDGSVPVPAAVPLSAAVLQVRGLGVHGNGWRRDGSPDGGGLRGLPRS